MGRDKPTFRPAGPQPMNLLFVTSFASDMYRVTGRHLVRSFLESGTEGTLLLCHEQNAAAEAVANPRIRRYDLDRSEYLAGWLSANRDIIPVHLGGAAERCDCPTSDAWGHRRGCAWGWFNKNASRWFRKIASLVYAQSLRGYDTIVWLDSDCRFKKRLPAPEIGAWLGAAAVFYLKSVAREFVESGVIGFRMNTAGRRFLRLTSDRYHSGEFRKYPRWDDGYQFQVTLDEHPEIPSIDLATAMSENWAVLPNSPAGEYLEHDKGVHARYGLTS